MILEAKSGGQTVAKQKAMNAQKPSPEQQMSPHENPNSNQASFLDLDQLVNGMRLLEILWDARSRPSLQWLRAQTKHRMIPFIRRGRFIFFRPRSVLDWYLQKEQRPPSMKGGSPT